MAIVEEIAEKVSTIAAERNMSEDYAFGFWFLEDIEELSQEEAEATVTGGPWDRGRDAVYFDEDLHVLKIYQMKYSEDRAYVLTAFKDLQRGVQAEYEEHPERFSDITSLTLTVVTKFQADEDFIAIQKAQQQRIRTWLSKRGLVDLSHNTHVDLFDIRKFSQLMQRLYGIDVEINFREPPVVTEKSLLGLIDARAFVPYIDKEELLAFNIRKFLGIRTGSVNAKIKETLENEETRPNFWTFNNGIVCLYRDREILNHNKIKFADFTIVNGAQTVSTIASFLIDNPTVNEDEPVWVVCKSIQVDPTDIPSAIKLTTSSNTQTPASGKDLRAVDQSHIRLQEWFTDLGITYLFKRGDKAVKGSETIFMKDIAQAFVAYYLRQPNVAFARPGTIFSSNDLYEQVFPPEFINELHNSAGRRDQIFFARELLLPVRLLTKIRVYLRSRTTRDTDDPKWRSMAYHMVYTYSLLLGQLDFTQIEKVLSKFESVFDKSIEMVFEGLTTLATDRKIDIPKSLKTEEFQQVMVETSWLTGYFGRNAEKAIKTALEE